MYIEGTSLPTIEAERLRLRWLTEADLEDLFAVFSDPEVMRYWITPPFESLDEARAYLSDIEQGFESRTLYQWGIARKADDRVIGTCTLTYFDRQSRRTEVGFALARASWGRGYMHEALKALFGYAFETLGVRRIEADVDPENQASLRTLERLGFQREGHLRERWVVGGKSVDSVFLGLLRSDWKPEASES